MIIFLTSSFIPYRERSDVGDVSIIDDNDFSARLAEAWPDEARLLFFASDPDDFDANDFRANELRQVLGSAGLSVCDLNIADHRRTGNARKLLSGTNVLFLAGGHAPTELKYMRETKLKEALSDFDGLVIGLSAGSVNAAEVAYLIPELDGESVDPEFVRFRLGLGLTPLQIIPHSATAEKMTLDGKRYIEDILCPDSYGRCFYLIPDGSYFVIENGLTTFYGNGEMISDGKRLPLKEGPLIPTVSSPDSGIWKTTASDGFDMVFTIDVESGVCDFYHINDNARKAFYGCGVNYSDLCERASSLLVDEEQAVFFEQSTLPVVLSEIKERGVYVRTAHMDTDSGRRAKNIRIKQIPGRKKRLLCTWFDISTAIDHDWMTDEYARTGFLEEAAHLIAGLDDGESWALIYTNVKGFKAVNELFGDQSGDMVIFQTRDALRKSLKPIILGRLESDHFVLIAKDSLLTPRRLKGLCRQTYKSGYKEYHYDIRLGIYRITDRDIAVSHMLDRAKLAEKSIRDDRGETWARYDELVRDNYVKQRVLLSDMKDAMDNGEFSPWYQPIVEAKTGRIASAEALIRWNHHDLGMVSPADFIPVIENAGRVSALDHFMAEQVFDFVTSRLRSYSHVVPCAINLSRIDFYDPLLMEFILTRLRAHQSVADLIRIEVTESAYADLEKNAMQYLNEMKRIGVKILLDDFGSGMSSLSTLESFAFDIVKLDIGFIRKIGITGKAEAIIESTIRLSHALGARVTAEGVENSKQLEFLKDCGCDYIQGYYFFKPLTEGTFAEVLDKEAAALTQNSPVRIFNKDRS